jgi:uncharacterized protein
VNQDAAKRPLVKVGGVTAEWNRPDGEPHAVVVLAHGAGGDLNDETLRGLGKRLADLGIAALRFNFPYREAGRKAPGAQQHSESCYREVAEHARIEGVPLYCGGKSYGGRMATHIAAQGFEVAGLVLLSYPLHPPGRPERLRDAHLKDITAPMLFMQGTRDPFASPDLLAATIASLPNATHVPIDGGDHSLRVKGRKRSDVLNEIVEATHSFIRRSAD